MLDDFEQLKRRVEEINAKKERCVGALEQVLLRLKKEFKCNTLEEAKALLIKLVRREQAASEQYAAAKEEFEAKWNKALLSLKKGNS